MTTGSDTEPSVLSVFVKLPTAAFDVDGVVEMGDNELVLVKDASSDTRFRFPDCDERFDSHTPIVRIARMMAVTNSILLSIALGRDISCG